MSRGWLRAIRLLSLLGFAVGVGVGISRVRRSPEQRDLTHYVEVELPAIRRIEAPIDERLDELHNPHLSPDAARTLLVGELIPRLLKLRKLAADATVQTAEVRRIHEEYLRVTDRLIEACRTSVQVIDDRSLTTESSYKRVQREFAAVRTAYEAWTEHLRAACERHRLSPARQFARPSSHD